MYKEFDDWFLEIENYGTRSERFYNSIDPEYGFKSELGMQANLLLWLKAAFEAGKSSNVQEAD